jgi:thiol:disulfide interchange protein DsbC
MVANSLVVALALASAAIMNVSVAQAPPPVAAVSPPAAAGAPPAQLKSDSRADARAEVAAHVPGARAEDLRATPVPGVFELTRGADIAYVSADGKYGFTGDLYELGTNSNLTEQHRRELRVKAMAAFPESEMVIFGPKDPKYTVTVFTDIDCPYCRRLHSQMADYNRLGIRVRYLLYPRTGPNTPY